ncbi:MAG: hypothetical protein AB7N76_31280 [Planctomycetota bacterium]
MTDEHLRALERRFLHTRNPDDELAWRRAGLRLGHVADPDALTAAAQLGHPLARALLEWPDDGPTELRDMIRGVVFRTASGDLHPEAERPFEPTSQDLTGRKRYLGLIADDLREAVGETLPEPLREHLDETVEACADPSEPASAVAADLAHLCDRCLASVERSTLEASLARTAERLLELAFGG